MGNQNPDLAACKKLLNSKGLLKRIVNFDKDNVSDAAIANLREYTCKNFNIEYITSKSAAAGNLATWILAIHYYCQRKELSG